MRQKRLVALCEFEPESLIDCYFYPSHINICFLSISQSCTCIFPVLVRVVQYVTTIAGHDHTYQIRGSSRLHEPVDLSHDPTQLPLNWKQPNILRANRTNRRTMSRSCTTKNLPISSSWRLSNHHLVLQTMYQGVPQLVPTSSSQFCYISGMHNTWVGIIGTFKLPGDINHQEYIRVGAFINLSITHSQPPHSIPRIPTHSSKFNVSCTSTPKDTYLRTLGILSQSYTATCILHIVQYSTHHYYLIGSSSWYPIVEF